MIINIPLQIDDEIVSKAVMADYQKKIEMNLTKLVEDRLIRMSGWSRNKEDGIKAIVDGVVADVIDKYREEVIERTASKLAERIVRTKAAKELADGKAEA